MIKKNIMKSSVVILILTSFCVVLPAEHNAIDVEINKLVRKICQRSQASAYEKCALVLGFLMQGIDKIARGQEQLSLRQARERQERIQAQISSINVRISEFRERQIDRCGRQQMLLQLKKVTHTQQPQYYKNNNRIKQQKHAQCNQRIHQPRKHNNGLRYNNRRNQ